MSSTEKVVSNTFYIFLMWFFSTIFGYLFWVILANFLPQKDVGIFSSVISLALFVIGLSFLGMNSAEAKLLPHYAAKKQSEKIGGAIGYVTKVLMLINILIAAVIFVLAQQLSAFYLNEAALRVVSLLIVVLSAAYLMGTHLYGLQKMKLYFLSEASVSFLKILSAFMLILLGFGWFGAAGGMLLSYSAILLLRLKWIPFRGVADKNEIWSYALPAFFAGIGTILINQGSIVFLSFLTNAAAVGAFAIAFMFTSPVKIIPQIISQAIFPVTSEEFTSMQYKRLVNLVRQSMRYSYLISIPVTAAFVFFAREFLLIFAKNYISYAFAFQTLAIGFLFFGLGGVSTGVLYYVGEPRLNRNINLLAGFANIILIFALVPLLGINGAAFAFVISGAIFYLAGLWYSRKCMKLPLDLLGIIKTILSAIIFIGVLVLFNQLGFVNFVNIARIWQILLSLIFAFAAYFASLLLLRFFKDVDMRILREFEKKLPKSFRFFARIILALIEKYRNW